MKAKQGALVVLLAAALAALGWGTGLAQDDIRQHRACSICGMDRKAYGYSRMLIHYRDGDSAGICSLRCAVVELDRKPGREAASLLVADRDTRRLIDAQKATWVVGGRKPGV